MKSLLIYRNVCVQDHTGPGEPAVDVVQAASHSAGHQESEGCVCAQPLRAARPLAH